MPAINGQDFLKRIRQLQPEIWLDGKKITDICNHEAFKGILTSKAALFDMQMNKDHMDLMTYVSPVSGERVGTSFLQPRTGLYNSYSKESAVNLAKSLLNSNQKRNNSSKHLLFLVDAFY